MPTLQTELTRKLGITLPVIGGAMYPCSNPELVAAISEAGGIGVIQPIALTYVHQHDFREGLRFMKRLTSKPLGMNALIEGSSKRYRERMERWLDIALEEGVRFFVTSLGNPRWVVDKAHAVGGVVYHDVTEGKWARKALDGGVDGLIAVNRRAGGHIGGRSAEELIEEIRPFGVPVVCAGGIGDEKDFVHALSLGYAGVQLGTRFIATTECTASAVYKQAIVDAKEQDIVHSERITGVPVAVLNTPYVQRMGLKAGLVARMLLRNSRTKHWMRTAYALRSLWQFKRSLKDAGGRTEYWQAGKSVASIHAVEPVGAILQRFRAAADVGSASR